MIPNGWQIRRGREMLGMSQDALGKAAGVGLAVVVHAELLRRAPTIPGAAAAIQAVLEARGIRFLWEDGGIGVEQR